GEAALLRVLAHHLLVRRHVDAVDLVAGHVALDPLDLRPEALQDAARLLRDRLQLLRAELAGAGDLTLDEVLRHGGLLVERPWAPSRVRSTPSPDMVQCTSVSEASWKAIALVAPARPASMADSAKAISL